MRESEYGLRSFISFLIDIFSSKHDREMDPSLTMSMNLRDGGQKEGP